MTMSRGESQPPARQPGSPGDLRCESARKAIASLLSEGRGLHQETSLREHLVQCADCNSDYRNSMLTETRLRRAMLDVDFGPSEARAPTRAVLSPIHIARAGFSAPSKGKATWVILLAVAFYAMVRLTPQPSGATRARLQATLGAVYANGEALAEGEPERELVRGDWVRTAQGVCALLILGDTHVELAPLTQLQIEEPAARRLRLEAGTVEIVGPLQVSSAFGIVEVLEGRASVSIEEQGLVARSTQGIVRAIDSFGERHLLAGENLRLARVR
jgi:hypothetical protein